MINRYRTIVYLITSCLVLGPTPDCVLANNKLHVAHVSSYRTQEKAKAALDRLLGQLKLNGRALESIIHKVDLPETGIWYRAQLGPPMSYEAATELCLLIKSTGHKYCEPRDPLETAGPRTSDKGTGSETPPSRRAPRSPPVASPPAWQVPRRSADGKFMELIGARFNGRAMLETKAGQHLTRDQCASACAQRPACRAYTSHANRKCLLWDQPSQPFAASSSRTISGYKVGR